MQFKSDDRVRRIGQIEVGTVRDIHEPEEYIVRLNPYAETMYRIQLGDDPDSCVWVKESKLELVEFEGQQLGATVGRVFAFVDTEGVEIHTIKDPEDKLPIPETTQVVTIGTSRMWVQSVTLQRAVHSPCIYRVSVRTLPAVDRLVI